MQFSFTKILNTDPTAYKIFNGATEIGVAQRTAADRWSGFFELNGEERTTATTRLGASMLLFNLYNETFNDEDGYIDDYTVDGVRYVNVTADTPVKFHVNFESHLNKEEKIRAAAAVEYWLGAGTITQNKETAKLEWGFDQQLHVTAEFGSGHFGGDLTYHDAIGLGDEEFRIGLLYLLKHGYRTSKRIIKPVPVNVTSVRFYYHSDATVKDNRAVEADWDEVVDRLDRLHETVAHLSQRLYVVEADNARLRNALREVLR